MNYEMDLKELKRARPYIISILAFIIYLVKKLFIEDCYKESNKFVDKLVSDIKNNI